ncbi:MAG: DUF177 domain-containing protein [Lachnospiraceae bacterium]|nr:DUF177 domain-containing protein [Lachnospiraceae bacterium]
MLVNLSDVLTTADKTEDVTATLEMETYDCRLGTYKVVRKDPVSLHISNTGNGKAHVKVKTFVTLLMSCDRCLRDVEHAFDLSFSIDVHAPSEEIDEDADENIYMEGYQLNVESLISKEMLMNWPLKVLCKSDCKGICKICGKDLNLGQCDCDTFVPDPRMAAIKDIFNANNKEV